MRKTRTEIAWRWRGYTIEIPKGARVDPIGLLSTLDGCVVTRHDGSTVDTGPKSNFLYDFAYHGVYIPLTLTVAEVVISDKQRIEKAIAVANEFASYDGAHHKNWVINEMLSALLTPQQREEAGWNDPDWLDECIAP